MSLTEGRCWCGSLLVGQPHNCIGTKERIQELIAEINRLEGAELRANLKVERILDLLKTTKLEHGICQPRSRRACAACNAQDELNIVLAEWKGPTIHPS